MSTFVRTTEVFLIILSCAPQYFNNVSTGGIISSVTAGPLLSDDRWVQEADRKGLASVWASILAEE